jgi:hypothetical protein
MLSYFFKIYGEVSVSVKKRNVNTLKKSIKEYRLELWAKSFVFENKSASSF